MASIRLNKELRQKIVNNIMGSYDSENPIEAVPRASTYAMAEIIAMLEFFIKQHPLYAEVHHINKTISLDTRRNILKYVQYSGVSLPLLGYEYVSAEDFEKYSKDLSVFIFEHENTKQIFNVFGLLSVNENVIEEARKNPTFEKLYQAFKTKYKEWKKASATEKAEWAQRRDYEEQVTMVVSGVNTTAQLLDAWPEVEKFIPAGVNKAANIQLPAVSIQQLNKFIKT